MIISLFIDKTPQSVWMPCCVRARPCRGEQPRGNPAHEKRKHQRHRTFSWCFRLTAGATESLNEPRSDPESRTPDPDVCQFVNRLILTFKMRPNAASVAMIDEPP